MSEADAPLAALPTTSMYPLAPAAKVCGRMLLPLNAPPVVVVKVNEAQVAEEAGAFVWAVQ